MEDQGLARYAWVINKVQKYTHLNKYQYITVGISSTYKKIASKLFTEHGLAKIFFSWVKFIKKEFFALTTKGRQRIGFFYFQRNSVPIQNAWVENGCTCI